MDVVHARCCGLDIHTRTVVACALIEAVKNQGRLRRLLGRCWLIQGRIPASELLFQVSVQGASANL